jgi:histidinol-phosphate aminotransferase
MSTISRRQWLRTTGLGIGAGVALPGLLPALEASKALGGASYAQILEQLERDVNTMRRAAGPTRLMYNENPFGMSPKAKDAMYGDFGQHSHYDLPAYKELQETFAKHVGVPADHVLVTQGSGEVLSVAAIAYGMHGGEMMAASPTFETLPEYAENMGVTMVRVPLDGELRHDLAAMDAKVGANTKLVFVCNPNNPTATLTGDAKLRDFVVSTAKKSVVLVDEAYYDFVDEPGYKSMTDLVVAGHNIIVSRTASKIHALAGLRVGFAVARPDIIKKLGNCITGAVNAFGMRAAIASLNDLEYQSFIKAKNREGRTLLTEAVKKQGLRVAPSQTNFVFFHTGKPVQQVQKYFAAKNFLVGRAFPPYTDWLRVSIGTPDEMKAFVSVLPGAFA